jgi:TonB family protein
MTLVVLRTTTSLQGIGKMATVHPLFKDKESMDSEHNKDGNTSFRPRSGGHTQAALLVLSANPSVLETVQRAAPSGSRVVNVATIDAAMEQLRSLRPGVLLIDAASCKDISGMVAQMMQDVPELAVVVAGKSEDSASLMKLAATGQIYRFLLTPLSHSQTKLTLEAALTQHQELGAASNRREAVAASDSNTERKSYLPAYIGLGAALVVVVAGVFYGVSHMGGSNGQQTVTQNTNTGGPAAKELALADAALAAGKLLEPPGESALDLYRSALGIDPKNARAKAGVDNVANKLLEKAEAALTAEQLESAITALEQARDVSPNNSRLKFLDGQVARERERLKLTQAQDTTKKVRSLLNEAQEDMDAGRFISPANSNARDAIGEARRTDPTDPSIAQAQRSLNTRIIEAARRAAEQNQLEQAQSLLAAARQMGSAGADLTAVERTLSEARTATAVVRPTPPPTPVAVAPTPAPTPAEPPKSETAATTSATAATSAAAVLPPVALKRIKTVTPTFPEEAKKRGLSGWVEVSFLVLPNGNVDGVKVQDSEPKAVFDFAAIQAVEQWRFEPPMRNGKPASQATKIKLRFDIPK